jgi:hypothetical protein
MPRKKVSKEEDSDNDVCFVSKTAKVKIAEKTPNQVKKSSKKDNKQSYFLLSEKSEKADGSDVEI